VKAPRPTARHGTVFARRQAVRREPAATFVAGVPHEAQFPPDERPPTVVVLQQRGHLPERDGTCGSKRKGRLGSH
jgi:hypothetical protein